MMQTAYPIALFLTNKARRLLQDRKGVTALEYSLIAGVTVVAIGTALTTGAGGGILGNINTIWTAIAGDLNLVAG